ncbi:hypothetical protein [Streptomyces sp. P8-A8]|uniref:hypothetical protein n=1 Tax=Streptomyces sp. P8-A8 TaxID=3029759 RepID=UPI0036D8D4C4
MAVIEDPEAGVASASVTAIVPALGICQDLAAGFELVHELVELVAGHAGQGGVSEQEGGLGWDGGCQLLFW